MDANNLRALQGASRTAPAIPRTSAPWRFKAEGRVDDTKIACKVETGRALAVAGPSPPPAAPAPAAGDMLLEALVACAGVTLKADRRTRAGGAAARRRRARRGVISDFVERWG